MEASSDCIACFLRQSEEATCFVLGPGPAQEQAMVQLRELIASAPLDQVPIIIGQEVHRRIRELCGHPDPYRAAKQQFNQLVLEVLPELDEMVRQADDQLLTATRLAIAANVIDLGSSGGITREVVLSGLRGFLDEPMHGDLVAFRDAVSEARDILYLTDNAGEIVVDQLLVQQLGPNRVTVAVRGGPVINDATMEDARQTGLTEIVKVLENGSDAPGTMVSDCSPEFQARFAEADLVISKGQGNYESLCNTTRPVFFLFKVKCQVVSEQCGLPLGTHALLTAGTSS